MGDKFYSDLSKDYAKTIKEEPVDTDDNISEISDLEDEILADIYQDNDSDKDYETSAKKRKPANEHQSNTGYEIVVPARPVTSNVVRNRDPRLANRSSNNNNLPSFSNDKRKAFLQGSIKSLDIINSMPTQNSDYMSGPMKIVKEQCMNALQCINSKPEILYSNIPTNPLAAGGIELQRSPLVSNNNNALFMAQATVDNVEETMVANRFRNIPLKLQNLGNLIGADLDSISRSISAEKDSAPEFHQNRKRSVFIQSDEISVAPVRNEVLKVDAEVQTTENTDVFHFSLTYAQQLQLTREQRDGLEVFKRLMGIKTDSSLSGVSERLKHKIANNSGGGSRQNLNGEYSNIIPFSNPPPPSSKNSSYLNATPR